MRVPKATGAAANTETHRTRFGKVRWTVDEYAEIVERAKEVDMTVSSYIRQAALQKQIVPRVDLLWIGELRRIGGLLRHRYPQVKASPNWTAPEKQKYWQTRDELLKFARQATQAIIGRKARASGKSGVQS